MKLLLIEDDDLLCQSLAFQFQKENMECCIRKNGLSGYQAFCENTFDLIIIDRMLPDIDGIEILKKIKKESINTPVILLTALGSLTDRVSGLDSGADDYITK
ncbi:MAG: response regulator, partial [Lachnospiraceae bacterium]|nr:response regulator [Lachnospiraceae bacterium]